MLVPPSQTIISLVITWDQERVARLIGILARMVIAFARLALS